MGSRTAAAPEGGLRRRDVGGRSALYERGRALAPGLLIAMLAPLALTRALVRASWATLGRDQGIFQYVAWAASQGDRAYRDVRDVNGPLVPLVHAMFLALGGADEHRFRVLDLFFTIGTSLVAGASLAWLVDDAGPSRAPSTLSVGRFRALRASSLAIAFGVAASAQYLGYGYWDTAQRESFFDWFLLVAIAAQIVASATLRSAVSRGARVRALSLLAVAGAASVAPWFGKPTYVLFTVVQLATLLIDDVATSRRLRLVTFAAGGICGALGPLLYLVLRGDPAAWMRVTFVDVPAMYRFIWPRPAAAILLDSNPWITGEAVATSVAVLALVVTRRLPRRALTIALTPLVGLVSVAAQAKGFSYHFHPVTIGTALGLVVLVQYAWERADLRAFDRAGIALRIGAAMLAIALGARVRLAAVRAPFASAPTLEERDPATEAGQAHLAVFDRVDFFPVALRQAAAYIAANTTREETVQTYGMDPYLLFLAQRRSATPYVYAYDLNVDAALRGSWEPGGLHPTSEQATVIEAMRDAHERDLLERIERSPPPAFVFIGRSPLMSSQDAVVDFAEHCPTAMAWITVHYLETADFDGIRVWLRRDRAALPAARMQR